MGIASNLQGRGPIILGVSYSLVLFWLGGGGWTCEEEGRGLFIMPDTQEKLTEIYDVQIQTKGKLRRHKTRKKRERQER